jgi:hypothetical protein
MITEVGDKHMFWRRPKDSRAVDQLLRYPRGLNATICTDHSGEVVDNDSAAWSIHRFPKLVGERTRWRSDEKERNLI